MPHITTNSDSARLSTSFPLRGTLKAGDGTLVRNAAMQVSLDPSPAMLLAAETGKNRAISLPLAQTVTDGSGNFEVMVPALRGVQRYFDGAEANLLFTSISSTFSTVYRLAVVLPKAAGSAPTSLNPDERALDARAVEMARTRHARLAGTAQAATPVTVPVTTVNLPATATRPKAGAKGTRGTSGAAQCMSRFGSDYYIYSWQMYTDPNARPQMYVPVQKIVTKSRTTGKFEWSNGKETQTTTGVSFAFSGGKGEGGYTKLVNQSGGVDFNVPHNDKYELQTNTEYRFYELYCASWIYVPYQWKDAKISELRPYDWTGGSRVVNSTAYTCPNSTYRQSVPAGSSMWTSRATAYTRTNSIGYGSFKLDANQKNTTSHKKTYFNTSSTSASICGQDNLPTKTDKVSEV